MEQARGPVARVRGAAAQALLSRVAGPEAAEVRHRIHRTPGPRWFAPDSPIGRVHGDASMFPGGIAALLLQSLHPRAMAAVAAHSGYRSDPWGRLQRTATFLASTTFATQDDAAQAVAVVRAVHARIRGVTPAGEPYEASDPHLLRWVHVAEVHSFLAAHQAYGRTPLDAAGCDEYVAQTAVVGRALGAVDVPETLADLGVALEGYRPELRATPEAREAATFLLRTPPLPLAARPVYAMLAAAGVGLLPRWSREPLRLPDVPLVDRTLVRGTGRLVTGLIRWALDPVDPVRTAPRGPEETVVTGGPSAATPPATTPTAPTAPAATRSAGGGSATTPSGPRPPDGPARAA